MDYRFSEKIMLKPKSMIPKSGLPVFGKDHAQTQKHDPEKWIPVFGKDHAQTQKHDPEKWMPVFGKDHARRKRWNMVTVQGKVIMIWWTATGIRL